MAPGQEAAPGHYQAVHAAWIPRCDRAAHAGHPVDESLRALEALEHAQTAVLVVIALPGQAALSVLDLEPAQPAPFV